MREHLRSVDDFAQNFRYSSVVQNYICFLISYDSGFPGGSRSP